MANFAIVTDDPGWHGRVLRQALSEAGHSSRCLSLKSAGFSLEADGLPIQLEGFENRLPDGVFVRGVPGGSLEQVTLALDVLHGLKLSGVPVYNEARAIERTVDKAMTSFLLHRAGLPTPPVWITQDLAVARQRILDELAKGQAVVSKPLFGSQGLGLRRYLRAEDLETLSEDQGVCYLQRYVDPGPVSHDYRVFVVAGRSVAAMRRTGLTWLNNVHQGARCEAVSPSLQGLSTLAEAGVKVLEMNYAGVDIICDATGTPSILEINSIPAWKGLQGVTEASLAKLLVADFLQTAGQATARPPAPAASCPLSAAVSP